MAITIITLIAAGAYAYLAWRHYRLAHELALTRQVGAEASSVGHFVEVDCAACGKLNRVPAARLRNRPRCGACRVRLLPRRKITLCHVRDVGFDPTLRVELDRAMNDYDRFWIALALHFAQRGVETGVKGPPN